MADGPPSDSLIDCIHDVCGGVAFRVTERPRPGDVMRLETVRLLDGNQPSAATMAICGSCGQPFAPSQVTPVGGYA